MSVTPPPAAIEPWEVLDQLTSLVKKSLVVYEEDEQGRGRYRLLETVRQYARERLMEGEEAEAVRGRHADYFLQLAERANPELRGPEQVVWADCLEAEHDNLRAALTWLGATDERAEAQARLASAAWGFWFSRGYHREGRQWTEEALSRGRHTPAPVRANALFAAGAAALQTGEVAAAEALLGECVALARAAGEKGVAGHALFHLAILALGQGECARATAHAQESQALAREVDDPRLRVVPLIALGLTALRQGEAVAARAFLEEGLALSYSTGDKLLIARLTLHLAIVAHSLGEDERAGDLYREALMRSQEVTDKRAIAGALCGLAAVTASHPAPLTQLRWVPARPERAARLFGAAEGLREAIGSGIVQQTMDPGDYDQHVAALRAQLDAEAFAAAWAEGRAMLLEEAVEYALGEGEAAEQDGA
jgi:hypothetical protein